MLPDISKWSTHYIKDISYLFYGCSQLTIVPDISKWNAKNFIQMRYLFKGCKSLINFLIFLNGIHIILKI